MNFGFLLFRIPIQLKGKENIPDPSQGYFIVANHQSFLDIPLILGKIRSISFLAKVELSKIPLFKYTMLKNNCVFIDRKNPSAIKKSIIEIKKKNSEWNRFCLFSRRYSFT